jgi:D-inositol-3-phosphate glycosyltransferase
VRLKTLEAMTNHSHGVLGFLFPQVAKESLVRNGPTSFTETLQAYIAKKLFPENLTVRGNLVAIDYITEALIRYGTMSRYELFVEPAFLEKAKAFSTLRKQGGNSGEQLHVTSILNLISGMDKYSLTAFFNPSGNFSQPLSLRNNFASKLYPVTVLTHGFSLHSMLYDGFLRLLLEGTYACDSLICTSRASRAAMANIIEQVAGQFNRRFNSSITYSGRLDVIPLCVDTDKFKPQCKTLLRRQLGLPEEAIVLLYLGYVSALKADLLPLLLVFRRLIQENPNRQLLLVIGGTQDASYAGTLKTYIKEFSLSKTVRLMDGFSDKTKYALAAASDVFVSPGDSVQESFGLTPIEAMACGVPQVVADWDGYRDTVSHGETGFLVPTYWAKCDADLSFTGDFLGWEFDHLALGQSVAIDVDALQYYLQVLIDNTDLRQLMSRNSRSRAETLYSFRPVVSQYEQLWEELSTSASRLSLQKRELAFAAPQYFECFKNHATSTVGDDSKVGLTALGCEAKYKDLHSLLHPKVSGYKTIDPGLVHLVLERLAASSRPTSRNGRPAASMSFGEVIHSLAGDQPFHPDYVRRNVMWLIKHGFVRAEAAQVRSLDSTEERARPDQSPASSQASYMYAER